MAAIIIDVYFFIITPLGIDVRLTGLLPVHHSPKSRVNHSGEIKITKANLQFSLVEMDVLSFTGVGKSRHFITGATKPGGAFTHLFPLFLQ
jgi:hypothetical protein